ncbi:hypothetical protein [Novosphingobium sp.]|uniref:hypothetical protein n=1 Tax=Novosphingobium sp. TaxID=1874826 RepID=UPI0025DA04C3|nr:hypothetical protein [Novosphingobium sp.]MCC6926266.1 hypothetical protein [Novosphingobium sp.]
MALQIDCDEDGSIGLDEFCELYIDGKFNAAEQESLVEAAPLLKKLANDRNFFGRFVIDSLTNNLSDQSDNRYGVGSLILRNLGRNSFLRVNCWSSHQDFEYIKKPDAFIYEMAHDHNFNFLTIGYFGPGYLSKYYEYDYSDLDGYIGESAGLKFIKERNLKEGDILLYRALQDVHEQFPPESMSVSINIMDANPAFQYIYQYYFDTDKNVISHVMSAKSSPSIFEIAGALNDADVDDTLAHISANSDCDMTRYRACKALVKSSNSEAEAEQRAKLGLDSNRRMVREMTRRYVSSVLQAS